MKFKISNPAIGLLNDELAHRGISQRHFAEACQISASYLSEILNYKKNISLEVALKVEATLGIRAGLLLDVQQDYELQKARDEMAESLGNLKKLSA